MRAAFGLVSLLVTVGLMLWLMVGPSGPGGASYMKTVSSANKQARSEVNVIAGNSPDGSERATDTIAVRVDASGQRKRVIVTRVDPDRAMDVKFGLKPGDRIVAIGPLDVEGLMIDSEEDAVVHLHDAYARYGTLRVVRDGVELSLPLPGHAEAMVLRRAELDRKARAAAGTAPPPPAPPPETGSFGLDRLRGVPTH